MTEITEMVEVELNDKQKDKYTTLARAMMGVKKGKIEEFEAAGVTMRINGDRDNTSPG